MLELVLELCGTMYSVAYSPMERVDVGNEAKFVGQTDVGRTAACAMIGVRVARSVIALY